METSDILRTVAGVGAAGAGAALVGINPLAGMVFSAASTVIDRVARMIFFKLDSSLRDNEAVQRFFSGASFVVGLSLGVAACVAMGASLTIGNYLVIAVSIFAATALFDVVHHYACPIDPSSVSSLA